VRASGEVITVCLSGGCDFDTVQGAVDGASAGDEIRVATGVYTGVSARAGVTQVVYISKSVTVRGGYTTTDWSVPNPMSSPTTLDAEGQGRVLYIAAGVSPTVEGLRITGGSARGLGGGPSGQDAGGGAYVQRAAATISGCQVVSNTALWGGGLYVLDSTTMVLNNQIGGNEGLDVDSDQPKGGGVYVRGGAAVLAGNTITANLGNWDFGGGLYLYRSDAVLQANRVTSNVARFDGGGLFSWEGAPRLLDNLFSGNAGEEGGGVYLYESDGGELTGNEFVSNTASDHGGGLFFYRGPALLTRSTIRSNSARYGGGAFLYETTAALSGSTIAANSAITSGGGLYFLRADVTLTNTMVLDNRAGEAGDGIQSYASSMHLLHSTIARNRSSDKGSGIDLYAGGSNAALTDTILVGHSVGVYANGDTEASLHATLWGSGAWANDVDWSGGGIVSQTNDYWGDPAFVDPDAGDYHIRAPSAAIDHGVDAGVDHDIDGDPRPFPVGGGFDLGADEYAEIDLSASRKGVHPDQAAAGEVLTYTIVLVNEGNLRSVDTLLVDAIPTQTTYISGSAETSAGLLTAGDSIGWSGTLTPYQPVTITFAVTLGEASAVRNTAVVTDAKGGVTTLRALVNVRWSYLPLILR
jgi:uncharacterized repeat protein (TIGR01451 family)